MFKSTVILAALASFVILCTGSCVCDTLNPADPPKAASVQNAGPSWNTHSATYNFASWPQSAQVTFAQAYSGADFEADFAAILQAVADALGTAIPPFTGSGKLNEDLGNWPDS